jgi:hypothetical protein
MEKAHPTSQTRYTKYAHNWLPTKRHLQRIDNTIDATCPSCKRTTEEANHILKCKHPELLTARNKGKTALTNQLTAQHTPSIILQAMDSGLHQWRQLGYMRTEFGEIKHKIKYKTDAIGKATKKAFAAQTKIGWGNFQKGRVSRQWFHAVRLHYAERKDEIDDRFNKERWTQTLIKGLLHSFELQWIARNAILHGHDATEANAILRQRLNEEITSLHSQASNSLQGRYRNLLRTPLPELLKHPTQYLRAWSRSIYRALTQTGEHNDQTTTTAAAATASATPDSAIPERVAATTPTIRPPPEPDPEQDQQIMDPPC